MSDKPSGPTPGEEHDHDCAKDHVHGPDCKHSHSHSPAGPHDSGPEVMTDASTKALAGALASSFAILKIIMGCLVVAFLLSNLKIVGPEERGVILRFGKPVGEGEGILIPPGPKLAWPYPIDEFQRVPISRLQQVTSTVGWHRTTAAAEATGQEEEPAASLDPIRDGYAMTGDANIVHIRVTLSYRITDPAQYLFAFENASAFLTNALNNAILHAAAQSSVNVLLTTGLGEFRDKVSTRLNTLIQSQQLGVTIDTVTPNIVAPRQVKQFFDQVLVERTKSQEAVTEARTEADLTLRKSESTAKSLVFAAGTQRTTDLIQLTNEVQRFRTLQHDYEKSPDLLKRRYLSELIQRTAPFLDNKFVLQDTADGSKQEIRLLINREEKLAQPNNPAEAATKADNH
jgi:modulator of FtsH protease HflK